VTRVLKSHFGRKKQGAASHENWYGAVKIQGKWERG